MYMFVTSPPLIPFPFTVPTRLNTDLDNKTLFKILKPLNDNHNREGLLMEARN